MAKIPLAPPHPDRTCWGCDKYCSADDLACGNGTVRTMHPIELFGDDWLEFAAGRSREASPSDDSSEVTPAAHDELALKESA